MSYRPAVFGVQCDAMLRGRERCQNKNSWSVPTCSRKSATTPPTESEIYRNVNLCCAHSSLLFYLTKENKRLRLHHAGYLGAFNEHGGGQLVINKPTVNWKRVRVLRIPKYWSDLPATKEVP